MLPTCQPHWPPHRPSHKPAPFPSSGPCSGLPCPLPGTGSLSRQASEGHPPSSLSTTALGAGKWVCAGSLTQYVTSTPPLPFLRSAWPALSTSRTFSPAAPPVFFPPSKPLQNLTTVSCSAAATLHGHHLMLTVSHSSENPNHTVVCRALGSLVPVGCLAVAYGSPPCSVAVSPASLLPRITPACSLCAGPSA